MLAPATAGDCMLGPCDNKAAATATSAVEDAVARNSYWREDSWVGAMA
jgi:hypothetical protein